MESDWYSFTGCCSSGTGHSVSGELPFLNEEEDDEEEEARTVERQRRPGQRGVPQGFGKREAAAAGAGRR